MRHLARRPKVNALMMALMPMTTSAQAPNIISQAVALSGENITIVPSKASCAPTIASTTRHPPGGSTSAAGATQRRNSNDSRLMRLGWSL